ncbi:MAG: 50S ribosomal protein L13 [Firmicutes bacterium]|nr:50S ribosomal protein L13 [Bacillota bacterium]
MKTTYMAKPGDVQRNWYVVDAEGKTLGRLAAKVASILRGKHKPTYTPHVDTGDNVIIINADKVVLTGKKATNKMVYRHTQYPGGIKAKPYGKALADNPERTIRRTVWGMLPHNRLGRKMIKKLFIYAGPEHPHAAQKPEVLDLSDVK